MLRGRDVRDVLRWNLNPLVHGGGKDEDRNTGVSDNETDGACIEVGGHRSDAGAR